MNKLILIGDAVKVTRAMKSESVDLMLTSPPYDGMRDYDGYAFDFEGIASESYRILKKGGVLVWIVGDQTKNGTESGTSFEQALYFKNHCGFLLTDTMIYMRHGPPLTHYRYEQAFEYMFVLTKGRPKTFNGIRVPKLYPEKRPRKKGYGRWKNNSRDMGVLNTQLQTRLDCNVWKFPLGKTPAQDAWIHQHPAIFPEELARRHIVSWSNPGDLVLDPFCGSGTTGKMAIKEGRRFIGIDISKNYAQMACRRVGLNKAYTFV